MAHDPQEQGAHEQSVGVGLVIVSHAKPIADGVAQLASQMAPNVRIVPAGGTADSGIGTDPTAITRAIGAADTGAGAVVLTDLGSAVMSAQMVVEMLSEAERTRTLVPNAPIVEGAVAAAVAAQGGANVQAVARAAEQAARVFETVGATSAGGAPEIGESGAAEGNREAGEGVVATTLRLVNPMGLHARPAAEIATKMQDLDVEASINGVDASSVMLLMTLGLAEGAALTFEARGRDAQAARDWIEERVAAGFDELG